MRSAVTTGLEVVGMGLIVAGLATLGLVFGLVSAGICLLVLGYTLG